MTLYDEESRCRSHLLNALTLEMDKRYANRDTWIENERFAITVAANQWAQAHALPTRISVEQVEAIEDLAVGHVDYAHKLTLYVTEMIYGHRLINP